MDAEVYPAEPPLHEQIEQLDADDAWTFPADRRRGPAEGQGAGPLELLPPRRDAWRRADQPPVRPDRRDHRPQHPARSGGVQLRRARHRQHGSAGACSARDEQKKQWLEPLLDGTIRSSFAMTEPQVASSDATNIELTIVRDGDDYVINGRKWWITGAMNPDSKIFIVMGKTDPEAERHRQQSMILVERDTPGLEIKRGMRVFGYHDRDHGGHAELAFHDVRVPASQPHRRRGRGLRDRPGAARARAASTTACARIGIAERAIEMMCQRASSRVAFGKPIADQGVVRDWIAESRVRHRAAAPARAQDRLADGRDRATARPTPRSRPSRSPPRRPSSGSSTRPSRCTAPAA